MLSPCGTLPRQRARRSAGGRHADQRGTSLLEVLVAILIMSFGMLALAGISLASLQYNKLSQFQSIGNELAAEYGDRMRANQTAFLLNSYNQTGSYTASSASVTVPTCAAPAACTPAEMASIDIAEWTNALRRRLPSGGAYVVRDTTNTNAVDIWILWTEASQDYKGESLATSSAGDCPAAVRDNLATGVAVPRCMYYRISQ